MEINFIFTTHNLFEMKKTSVILSNMSFKRIFDLFKIIIIIHEINMCFCCLIELYIIVTTADCEISESLLLRTLKLFVNTK